MHDEYYRERVISFSEGGAGEVGAPRSTPPRGLSRVARMILVALAFLLPVAFLPEFVLPIGFVKNNLLAIGVVGALLLWLVERLKAGELTVPRTRIASALVLLFGVFAVSSIFSGAAAASFFGVGDELGTTFTMGILVALALLAALLLPSLRAAGYMYAAVGSAALFIALFHGIRFVFGADTLTFGVFFNQAMSIIGKWNDLGVLFGAVALGALLWLQVRRSLSPRMRLAAWTLLGVSLAMLAVVAFVPVWVVLGLFALALSVYHLSYQTLQTLRAPGTRSWAAVALPALPIAVVVISALFAVPTLTSDTGESAVSAALADRLGIVQLEARPSWAGTVSVVGNVLREDPIFGLGPNRFAHGWALYKPEGVNETVFWNTNFNFGVGMVPSVPALGGLLGAAAIILLLFFLLREGARHVLVPRENPLVAMHILSAFAIALYFWIMAIVYVPGVVNMAFAFLFTGLFVAMLRRAGAIPETTISFLASPRVGFAAVLATVVLIAGTVATGYFVLERVLAGAAYNSGLRALNVGDIAEARTHIARAARLYPHDVYYRSLSDVEVLSMRAVAQEGGEGAEVRFQNTLQDAIGFAQRARDYDRTNYQNWITLARVYQTVIPLGVQGAYEATENHLDEAGRLNPTNPIIPFMRAQAEIARGDIEAAKTHVEEALALKRNYTAAIFLLSQIQADEGDLAAAIQNTEQAALLSPNESGVFFQLGFLRYKNESYTEASRALERAVALNPDYANALYFLGLSYDKLGRGRDAIAAFERVRLLNPGNTEVERILENLQAGRDPFARFTPPLPDDREEPPIEE